MWLSNELIRQFVQITNDKKRVSTESILYGTVILKDDGPYVQLDGSDVLTPVSSTADIKDGERVTVLLKNHSAIVTGNISSPSASSKDLQETNKNVVGAAKTATNYIKYTDEDGLVVGNMSDAELKRNVQIVSDAVNIRNGSTILASYSDDEIYLGKNSKKSIIDLCNGSAQMSYVSDSTTGLPYFEIKSGENLRLSAIYTEPGGRKGVTGASLRSMGRAGDTDYADSHWQVSSRIQDGDNSSLAMASGEAGVIWLYTIAKGEAQLKVDGQNSTIEMIGKVTIRDSESGEVGCTITGGVATLADVKTKSGASLKTLDPPKKYTYTTSGITVTVWESPLVVRVKVTGATEAELATKSGYISIASLKATGMTPAVKKIWVQTNYEVSLRLNASKGKIELGYSAKNGTMVDIPSGIAINIDETFLLV